MSGREPIRAIPVTTVRHPLQFYYRYELRFQSLPNSRKANINNVVRVTDDASLNRLPDYPFLLWI
jgi:hypothetical protein